MKANEACHKLWAEFVTARARPTLEEVRKEGWLTSSEFAALINRSVSSAKQELLRGIKEGTVERGEATTRNEMDGRMRVTPVYRPKAQS